MSYSERTQVLLSPAQRERVERLAAQTGRSVGAVIRDAIDAYAPPPVADERWRALEDLFSIDAPVDDWETMEAEIIDGYVGSERDPADGSAA